MTIDRRNCSNPAHIEQMLTDLNEEDEGLNGWELDFLDSVTQRFESGLSFTDRQAIKLFEIWSKL